MMHSSEARRRYQVISSKKTVGLLLRPDVSCEVTGYLQPHESFDIDDVAVDAATERTYFRLADGRGWVAQCSRKESDRVVVQEVDFTGASVVGIRTHRKRSSGAMESAEGVPAPMTPDRRPTAAWTESTPTKRARHDRSGLRASVAAESSHVAKARQSSGKPCKQSMDSAEGDLTEDGQAAEKDDVRGDASSASGAVPEAVAAGTNERKLHASVVAAAGMTREANQLSLTQLWEKAKHGLKIASVGYFQKGEARACACGQKPLLTVYHLRHESTGRRVDVGASCAKKCGVNVKAQQEAERALKNLKQLEDNPNAQVNDELLKMARENHLLTAEESKLLKEASSEQAVRASQLKEIMLAGLDLCRRSDAEICSLVRKHKPDTCRSLSDKQQITAVRQAVLRLALLGAHGRKELLKAVNLKRDLRLEDLILGAGSCAMPEKMSSPEKMSLLALAVSRGHLVQARMILDVFNWQGFHALAALHAGIRCGQSAFVEQYLAHKAVAPPDSVSARLVLQTAGGAKCIDLFLAWVARKTSSEDAALFLDDMLKWACAVGSVATIDKLLSAGARDSGCHSILNWCERLCGDQQPDAVALPNGMCGADIARRLLQAGAQTSIHSSRRLDRNALHLAAASGDVSLVDLFLGLDMSPWETTRRPSKAQAVAGLGRVDRKLPLEVARKSSLDTATVEDRLRKLMENDLRAVRKEEYACYISAEDVELIENHLRASTRLRRADHTLLRRFDEFARLIHRDPAKARVLAQERRMELLSQQEEEEADEGQLS